MAQETGETTKNPENVTSTIVDNEVKLKLKRKKLKGKRAVVKWLKFFRWRKKIEYKKMTAEEKILYKLRKAQKKEARLTESLEKIEPPKGPEATHDPEVLTPEEHFYYLKMGHKCKNYVPVGRRGIFQGVILNMHLHWKKHQTLKVVVKTFSPEEVRQIAAELARLSGGIVLDIHEGNTIIMYRGKNYSQPPTEIMSPRITLSRKKALDKSKYRDALRAIRIFILRLEQDLQLLHARAKREAESKDSVPSVEHQLIDEEESCINDIPLENSDCLQEFIRKKDDDSSMNSSSESDILSDSEDLSDIFETVSDDEQNKVERPLYLDAIDKLPDESGEEPDDFVGYLKQFSKSKECGSAEKDREVLELDEVDRLFLRAASLMQKKKR